MNLTRLGEMFTVHMSEGTCVSATYLNWGGDSVPVERKNNTTRNNLYAKCNKRIKQQKQLIYFKTPCQVQSGLWAVTSSLLELLLYKRKHAMNSNKPSVDV